MGAIGQYINVKTVATGEVRQVNLYSSLDDVGGEGKEFAYGGTACWAAVSEDENHENKSNWAYKAANGAIMQVLTHWEESGPVEFNMYNWAWANYEAATGEDHTALTSFGNASARPSSAQLRGVTNGGDAFFDCQNLTDVSPFARIAAYGDAVNFSRMFRNCTSLADFSPLAGWDTANVERMAYTFYNCLRLTDLSPLAGWDTGNMTNMTYMFCNCKSLTALDGLANWDTGNVTTLSYMFCNCYNLADCGGVANWDTGNVTGLMNMFYDCRDLTGPSPLANWNVAKVTSMAYMFFNCSNLTGAGIPETLATSVNCALTNAFRNCTNLQGDIWFYGNNVNNAVNCFNGCNAHAKNIHAYADSLTWNSFYRAMGNSTHNDLWNADLVEI